MGTLGIGALAAIIFVVVIALFVLLTYVKTSPEQALVISGIRKKPKVLIGRGGIRIPFFQRIDRLYLGQTTVDVNTREPVQTNDFQYVMINAVSKIELMTDNEEDFHAAQKNFLNKGPKEISEDVRASLEGNMREVIGAMKLTDIITNRKEFSNQVIEKAANDMGKLGVNIISWNIQNISDNLGVIEKLGADRSCEIKKNAAITKANADRDVAKAEAEAKKNANDVVVLNETAIAEKNNALAIRKAELKVQEDTKKAIADAAYKIQEQEQLKVVNEKTVEAEARKEILLRERLKEINKKGVEADIEKANQEAILTEKKIAIKRNELSAEINRKADANKYQVEVNAEAELEQRKRNAEAKRYEAEQQALAVKAQAEAEQFRMEQEAIGKKKLADASAYLIEMEGLAEAQAIEKKGLAEAQAMEKKADAFKKYGQAAMAQMVIEKLPEIAKEIAAPMSAIDNVNIYGTSGEEVGKYTASTPIVIQRVMDTVKNATGVDMSEVMKAETIDAKVNKNVNLVTDNDVTVTKDLLND